MVNGRYAKNGFTLIELSFVLVIFGIVTMTVMMAFSLYNKQQVASNQSTYLQSAKDALGEYQADYHYYPCPADPTLPTSDLKYGVGQRDGAGNCIGSVMVMGTDPTGPAPVFIGAVPFKTIIKDLTDPFVTGGRMNTDFSEADSLDAYNDRLTYAVSGKLTSVATYNQYLGAINVVDEHNVSILTPNKYAHFVIVSHGPNGRGAYSRNGGGLISPCVQGTPLPPGPGPLPLGATRESEVENCDFNSTFLSGLSNERDDSYNDDSLKFAINQNGDLWISTDKTHGHNTNFGNVGIGTDKPTQQLHAAGDISAYRVDATHYYTDAGGGNRMPANALGGDGAVGTPSHDMRCQNPGEVVTKIEDNKVKCDSPFTTVPPNALCPKDPVTGIYQAMYGISTTGPMCCDTTIPGSCP